MGMFNQLFGAFIMHRWCIPGASLVHWCIFGPCELAPGPLSSSRIIGVLRFAALLPPCLILSCWNVQKVFIEFRGRRDTRKQLIVTGLFAAPAFISLLWPGQGPAGREKEIQGERERAAKTSPEKNTGKKHMPKHLFFEKNICFSKKTIVFSKKHLFKQLFCLGWFWEGVFCLGADRCFLTGPVFFLLVSLFPAQSQARNSLFASGCWLLAHQAQFVSNTFVCLIVFSSGSMVPGKIQSRLLVLYSTRQQNRDCRHEFRWCRVRRRQQHREW